MQSITRLHAQDISGSKSVAQLSLKTGVTELQAFDAAQDMIAIVQAMTTIKITEVNVSVLRERMSGVASGGALADGLSAVLCFDCAEGQSMTVDFPAIDPALILPVDTTTGMMWLDIESELLNAFALYV